MTAYKCKICGSDLQVPEGASVVKCENCGSEQTISTSADDILVNLFNRANSLRLKCEFDRSAETYEKILDLDNSQAEAHWGIVLCKYGIEYVEATDGSDERKPTCHRTQLESILTDADYLATIQCADANAKTIYEAEAHAINLLQKKILDIVKSEKPFDVFICYKERDEENQRTRDSVIASEIYCELINQGLKVFFASITLEEKIGEEYEPYIYAALSTAKVMIVIGTKPEHFNAVWVKNEWSRYLHMMKHSTDGKKRTLIPCYRDMDAYDLPDELSLLQALDMSKIAFINDLIRSVKKLVTTDNPKDIDTNPLLTRAFIFLEESDFEKADNYFEQVLDKDPKNAKAYVGKLMVSKRVTKEADLAKLSEKLSGNSLYENALRFADDSYRKIIEDYEKAISANLIESNYQKTVELMISGEYLRAADGFVSLQDYKNSVNLATQCRELSNKQIYDSALHKIENAEYLEAVKIFERISEYKDAKEQIERCYALNMQKTYDNALNLVNMGEWMRAANIFKTIIDFKDARKQIEYCYNQFDQQKKQEIYDRATSQINTGDFIRAAELFESIVGFKDAANQVNRCSFLEDQRTYDKATELQNKKRYIDAAKIFERIPGFKDAKEQAKQCKNLEKQKIYDNALALVSAGEYLKAANIFDELSDFKDAKDQAKNATYLAGKSAMAAEKFVDGMALFYRILGYLDSKNLYDYAQAQINKQNEISKYKADLEKKETERKIALKKRGNFLTTLGIIFILGVVAVIIISAIFNHYPGYFFSVMFMICMMGGIVLLIIGRIFRFKK